MKKQSLLFVVSFLLLFSLSSYGQLKSSMVFAPSDSYIKPSEQPYRTSICLNGQWDFQPVSLPDNFKEGIDLVPNLSRIKSDKWDKVPIRIPSPWNVNSFADKNGQGGDFRCFPSYPHEWEKIKMGWLRKKFTLPKDWKGRRIQIHFDAVAGDAEIVVNGKSVGRHFDIFMPFDIDVTDVVDFTKENELCVGVRKASLFDKRSDYGRRTYQAGSFWGQHAAGIWQDVNIVALPNVRVADTYIRPMVDVNKLEAELTLVNESNKDVTVSVNADVYKWIAKAGTDVASAPLPSSDLDAKSSLDIPSILVKVPAGNKKTVVLSTLVNSRLRLWSPDQPNLYGFVVKTSVDGKVIDSKYTRFGWRQITLNGRQFLVNGKPYVMKGDSWHFLGIPQMTRRYAWAWYKAMRDANLNAVRLHAQPYPSFYLDVADEMGILVLDETAVWASDGGPKLNDPAYWNDSKNHLTALVTRDRNHPSIFGWSVSNEVKPIVRGVMRNPVGMMDTLVKHYGIWADICRKMDPTRAWISADGEDDGDGKLPTYVVHYGGVDAMKRGAKSGLPWGVGEAGNAYYGTPEQVSEANGSRAYESFLGRMEGVAISSYESLINQRANNATYRSVFNMIWYGLRPLALGQKDASKAPTLNDGVYFQSFEEGKTGVQPERIGPYCTTLNPGYDPSLPLYRTWPLFDAIHDACAEPVIECKWKRTKIVQSNTPVVTPVTSVKVLSGVGGRLAADLKRTGVPVAKLDTKKIPALLFIDGVTPPDAGARTLIDKVTTNGGTVVVWGANPAKTKELNQLLPAPVEITNRVSSSLVIETPDELTSNLTLPELYFSELRPAEIISQGLAGPLVQQSSILLKACETDWLSWNKQPEFAKTAMVVRSEVEAKPSGAALIMKKVGKGRILVTTLPAAPRLSKAEKVVRKLLANLGLSLGEGSDVGKPLLKTGDIVRTLMCGSFPIANVEDGFTRSFVNPVEGEQIRTNAKVEDKPWKLLYNETGSFDFSKVELDGPSQNGVVYLSFWVASPRALDDLLIEPNIPVVNLEISAQDATQVWLNGKQIISNKNRGVAKADALKFHQGWNHFLIKITKGNGGWDFSGRLVCNLPDFLAELESALEKP
jgi:hypothetical protein